MSFAGPLPRPDPDAPAIDEESFRRLSRLVHGECGIVLNAGKKSLVVSRLARRLRALGAADFAEYCRLVEADASGAELRELLFLITTNVTRFFREPHHFEALRRDLLPELVARARRGGRVRIWSAGCSSGEEPYSLAMTVLEALPDAGAHDIRILATDLDANMIAAGRRGTYAALDDSVPAPLRERYFTGRGATCEIGPAVRSLVTFAELNLLRDWPMKGPFDIIFCRNVVIYFDAPTQARLWERFAALLPAGGRLYIGHSERVSGTAADRLRPAGTTEYIRA